MTAFGDCIATRSDGHILIVHADPKIRISSELIEAWREDSPPEVALIGDVVTFNAANRKVVYRIDWDDFDGYSYGAEWPD